MEADRLNAGGLRTRRAELNSVDLQWDSEYDALSGNKNQVSAEQREQAKRSSCEQFGFPRNRFVVPFTLCLPDAPEFRADFIPIFQ